MLLLLAGVALTLAYAATTELPVWAVAMGALSVCFTNMSELRSNDLQREEQILRLHACTVGAKIVAVLATWVASIDFSTAMTLAAALTYLLLRVLKRGEREQRGNTVRGIEGLRLAYDPHLIGVSIASILSLRLPFLVAPYVMTPVQTGAFATLLSTQQYVNTFLTTGLYTVMAIRAKNRANAQLEPRMARLERAYLAGSFAVCFVLLLAGPAILGVLGFDSKAETTLWAVLIVIAIPAHTLNRAAQYRFHASQDGSSALRVLSWITGIALGLSFAALIFDAPLAVALIPLVSEALVAPIVYCWARSMHPPRSNGRT
ncbi:hypothetical protein [Knoellia sinensis]|nr:hypothetical protein [Knoellia sinensis]